MANGANQAVSNATRLPEMRFPEFTAKLITDTFDAITASYIHQMAQYVNVVKAVGQTLEGFINDTAADIGADQNQINAFLVSLSGLSDDTLNFLLGDSTATGLSLSGAEATAINDAVALPAAAGSFATTSPAVAGGAALTSSRRASIAQAIARRIAANKYDLLQTMVKQGVLRLYVDNGTIETRLTFSTYGSAVSSSSQTAREVAEASKVSGFGGGGGFGALLPGGGIAAGAGATSGSTNASLSVSTANSSQRDVTGSRVQIFGRVKLNFKSDFVPLAASQP